MLLVVAGVVVGIHENLVYQVRCWVPNGALKSQFKGVCADAHRVDKKLYPNTTAQF